MKVGTACAREVELRISDGREAAGGTKYLGFAHGTAGRLHALLRWQETAGRILTSAAETELEQLATRAEVSQGHARWPLTDGGSPSGAWSGWCHGTAGYVLLWSKAAEVLGRQEFLELGLAAAEEVWSARPSSSPSLCCGRAGQAIALATLGRRTGLDLWSGRAQALAGDALRLRAGNEGRGLFKGDAGPIAAAIEATAASPLLPVFGGGF